MQKSGTLLILAMLAIGLVAAGASWWFRYSATHRAAEFWGPAAARLIRDAPRVELMRLEPSKATGANGDVPRQANERLSIVARRDISSAGGLTHLRHALLEDRSFAGSTAQHKSPEWRWKLQFEDPDANDSVAILFSDRCDTAGAERGATNQEISTEPIAHGLVEVFTQWLPK